MNLNKIITNAKSVDWFLLGAIFPVLLAGLFTMSSFSGDSNIFFNRQVIWIFVSLCAFFFVSSIDLKFLRKTEVVVGIYGAVLCLLVLLYVMGSVVKGAQGWFSFGAFSVQPSEFAKLALILVLAKYFSRRHIEIKNLRHIIVSGIYAGIIFVLVALQPDFGSALIIFSIWFGMVMVSGISKKHLLLVFTLVALVVGLLWNFVFYEYQKQRIMTFIHPLQDIRGVGYNAYQSTITVGSGQIIGKGLGYGTQSRLKFLPEYQTDFIFAAYAEEWGFVGVLILFALYLIILWRILSTAINGATNFEMLFGVGITIMFVAHLLVHIGMNVGVMPVTGITIPFMSYGGSHLLVTFIALGILQSMKKYSSSVHKDVMKNEFLGV
ncbi:MAG: rod shape-determining protein RodA, rod shape determining protein RodA [Candidatus Parcubacteria bacterium]|jgi:rod shape determining protein RodA